MQEVTETERNGVDDKRKGLQETIDVAYKFLQIVVIRSKGVLQVKCAKKETFGVGVAVASIYSTVNGWTLDFSLGARLNSCSRSFL